MIGRSAATVNGLTSVTTSGAPQPRNPVPVSQLPSSNPGCAHAAPGAAIRWYHFQPVAKPKTGDVTACAAVTGAVAAPVNPWASVTVRVTG